MGERALFIIYEYCFSLCQLAAQLLIHKADTNYSRDVRFTGRPKGETHTHRSRWSNEPVRELDKTVVFALFLMNINNVKDLRQWPADKAVYTLRAKSL